jgi:phenylacetate-CoA ligase
MTECEQRRLHVDMEFGIVEVEVEESAEDWERGPLLVTGLSNDATPFLRYRVGDVGTRSRTPCPCGRPGDVFLDVDGRIEDYVMTPDGRLVGRLDHIFKEQLDVAEAQILQETRDAVEVHLVRRPSWSDASERSLMKEIRSRLGDAIQVELRFQDSIPREPNGKFRAVKSKVGRSPR